ncbi:hypothetical protein [Streptomyces sp. NPDC002044]|uniref:protein kinase domain-containing protein n=1 Tax=Streptomyces sp. NPDC002044 TaxID=3154662 RepID=UPI0033270255
MRFLKGPSLPAEVAGNGRLPRRRAAAIGAQVADAPAHAHRQGLVHREVKPDNIGLARDRAVLTDFGIVPVADAVLRMTVTGQALGTPLFIPPSRGREAGGPGDVRVVPRCHVARDGGGTTPVRLPGRPPQPGRAATAVARRSPRAAAHRAARRGPGAAPVGPARGRTAGRRGAGRHRTGPGPGHRPRDTPGPGRDRRDAAE